MFLCKTDQVLDLQRAAIIQDHVSLVTPKHLMYFAEDDA
jgi:hypothetical protein